MEQKMYWKDGFYDTPQEGAIEITKKYWQELLDGQSAGLIIVENEKGYPVLKEYKQTLLELKAQKISELQAYDSSESVNSFSIDNVSGWLNKATRVGLMNSISIERESGRSETTIWLNDAKLVLSIEKAIDTPLRVTIQHKGISKPLINWKRKKKSKPTTLKPAIPES